MLVRNSSWLLNLRPFRCGGRPLGHTSDLIRGANGDVIVADVDDYNSLPRFPGRPSHLRRPSSAGAFGIGSARPECTLGVSAKQQWVMDEERKEGRKDVESDAWGTPKVDRATRNPV